jgi:hypothetical protein
MIKTKNNATRFLLPIAIIAVVVIFFGSYLNLTGAVISSVELPKDQYVPGESLGGSLKLQIYQGDLIPSDTRVQSFILDGNNNVVCSSASMSLSAFAQLAGRQLIAVKGYLKDIHNSRAWNNVYGYGYSYISGNAPQSCSGIGGFCFELNPSIFDCTTAPSTPGTYTFVFNGTTSVTGNAERVFESRKTFTIVGGIDNDGDGYYDMPYGDDCDDNNEAVNPGATELCNGIDDNCDGNVDEGCAGLTVSSDLYAAQGWARYSKMPNSNLYVEIYQCAAVDGLTWKQMVSKKSRVAYINKIKSTCTPVNSGYTDNKGDLYVSVKPGLAFVTANYASSLCTDNVELGRVEMVQNKPNNKIELDILRWNSRWDKRTECTPMNVFFVSGSELKVLEPAYIEWADGQTVEDYPIIHESNDTWVIEDSISLPEGFVADAGTKVAFVDNSTETAVFEVREVGSTLTGSETTYSAYEIAPEGLKACTQLKADKAAFKNCLKARAVKVENFKSKIGGERMPKKSIFAKLFAKIFAKR